MVQLHNVIAAIFSSWNSPKARQYRDVHNIPYSIGTAVIVQQMVHANLNFKSGSGIASTRNGITGCRDMIGEFQGQDVYSGRFAPLTLKDFRVHYPLLFETLSLAESKLEKHFKDMQDIEFTVENGEVRTKEQGGVSWS